MAEEYTAASLSKKTVVQLKGPSLPPLSLPSPGWSTSPSPPPPSEAVRVSRRPSSPSPSPSPSPRAELLATHSLPVTGKKDDLIQRLLAHLSTLSSEPTTTDTTGAASAVDEPDGQGHSGTAEVSQAANVETEKSAEEVVDGVRTAPGAEEAQGELDAGGVKDKEEEEEAVKKQAREAEEEKRRKRAERFNVGGGGSAGPSEEEVAKLKRAEKFGTGGQKEEQQADGGKLDKVRSCSFISFFPSSPLFQGELYRLTRRVTAQSPSPSSTPPSAPPAAKGKGASPNPRTSLNRHRSLPLPQTAVA